MWLIHGKAITSEEVERIVSRQFAPQKFASLCNSVGWTSAGKRCTFLPSFTERVNAKDNGIDVEWQTNLPDDHTYSSSLLGPGWNVFQYKKRDIFAQGRDRTFSNLKAGLKGAAKDLHERTGQRPDRYVLFTNLDLTHFTKGQKGQLKERIIDGYDQPGDVHVEIVGAADLSAFLNDLPHLRSAFFTSTRFSTWQEAWLAHTKKKLFGAKVKLVGRNKELVDLRSMIDEPKIRAVVLSGPHNIGKTRLAFEATDHRPVETVVALDPRSMSVSDLLALESPGVETVVIIEDPDMAEEFVNEVLAHTGLKLLITLPTAEKAPTPNFGRDDRIQVIQLDPLSDSQAHEILEAAGAKLDYSMESWVIEQAGGNPGILLFAASLGPELRKSAATFADDVARTFEQKIRRELGNTAIEILKLLSLLTHVGIRGTPYKEIEAICSLFGRSLQPNAVHNYLPRLMNAGIIRMGGSYVEVLPPLFANSLAVSALRARFTELCALFAALNQAARLRLIRRLRALKGEEVTLFWDELFAPNGLFKDLPSALTNGYLLRLVAGTVPERVSRLVEEGLERMNLKERLSITGDARRELMWTLEELLFRKETSTLAVRCLALLAEAETENYGNNATGVFCECFHPLHPQLPLPLQDRFDLLKEILSPKNSVKLRLVGVKAIESGLSRLRATSLRRSSGPEPLDSRPHMTYGDVWNYAEALVDLLMKVAESEEPILAKSAIQVLPRAIAECAIQARPEVEVVRFQTVVDWVLTDKVPVSISDLTEALRLVLEVFNERSGNIGRETAAKLKKCTEEIEALINRLDKGDFPTRLKRWAGNWTRDDHEYKLDERGKRIYRVQKELQALSVEAVDNPEALTDDLLIWLCSDDAKKAHMFFWWLGKMDSERMWLPRIEEMGTNQNGATAFSAYFGGLSQTDRPFISKRLDELTGARKVTPEATVRATGYLGGDLPGVKRMETLIQEKLVDPVFVERVLVCGGWIDSLTSDEYLRLLKAIADPNLKNAGMVIDFFGMWLHNKRPIKGQLAEFAWQCLEAAPPVTASDAYNCDQLASKLAQSDTERGFRLLEELLTQPYERERWNPIDRYGRNKFWNVLHRADRKRGLRLVLSLALDDPLQRLRCTWNLREVMDQESDADVLMEFGLESKRQAELVCESITRGRPGFWPIALKIIERHPNSRKIQSAMASGVEQIGAGISGPYSIHLENCRKDVERVLNDAATPAAARPWLEQLESSLCTRAERELISEIDEDVNDLRRVVEDPAAPERLWAIKTLLRHARVDEIRKLLSKDELLTILPKLQLPENELEEIRSKIEDWR